MLFIEWWILGRLLVGLLVFAVRVLGGLSARSRGLYASVQFLGAFLGRVRQGCCCSCDGIRHPWREDFPRRLC
jgi:hypothetical protein